MQLVADCLGQALERAFRNMVNATVHSQSNEILTELKKVNSRLETFCELLDSLDGRLKTVEDMQVNLVLQLAAALKNVLLRPRGKYLHVFL